MRANGYTAVGTRHDLAGCDMRDYLGKRRATRTCRYFRPGQTVRTRRPEPLWFRIAQLGSFVGAISMMGGIAIAFAGELIDAAGATPVLHSLVVNVSAAAVAFAGVALQNKFIGARRS
jgi:hypothetical protein